MTAESAVRNRPLQARSQARFDRIVAAAAALLGELGTDSMTMTDIAERADMALTAVYRYFPNKASVLRELALRTFADDTATLIEGEIAADATAEDLVTRAVQEFWNRHRAEPFRLPLRVAIHADAELSELDLAESRRNARTIAEALAPLTGRTDAVLVERQALLVVELSDSLMRLVARVSAEEAEGLLEEFTAMVVRTFVPGR